ncbi:TraR/DksA family transcriptional regulator [Candidatus Dependentiae bacterium]|nr:TraR/DksA family transcriptional regulator [Candidatus Dependentiae bacterium]
MNNLTAIKESLLSRKVELEYALSLMYKEKVSDDQVQDTGDQALSSTLEELKISLHNNELDEYQRIVKALDMIENGSYGICSECGNPISEKRLLLFPNATRCLACQEAVEEGRL